MIVISRFVDVEDQLAAQLQQVAEFWRQRPGCLTVDVAQNLDDPSRWVLLSRWENVGAYRRAYNGYEAKALLTPILSQAVDEPSAYLAPQELGQNIPRTS